MIRPPQGLQRMQGAGLTAAGAAGDADDKLRQTVRVHNVKARRLLQPVAHRQAQAGIIRTLGIDMRNIRAVKPAQGVKDPVGLLGGILRRSQGLQRPAGKPLPELLKADDTLPLLQRSLYKCSAAFGPAGDHCHRGVGGIVAILHTRSPGRLAARYLLCNGLVHGHLAQNTAQVLQRQAAGTQESGRADGEVDNGGLHPHPAGPAVHDAVYLAVHILQHVGGAGRAGPAGGIAAGGGHRHSRRPDNSPCNGVIRAADAHGL